MINSIEQLRKIPISDGQPLRYSDYSERKTYYWLEIIANIKVDIRHRLYAESLGRCVDFDIMQQNYYSLSKILEGVPEAKLYLDTVLRLRTSVLKDLQTIDQWLKKYDLRILILSGYRHPNLQRLILTQAKKIAGEEIANRMLANPDHYSPHASGGVFDVELWDKKNNRILPTKIKNGERRDYLENRNNLTVGETEIRDNRRIIHHLLSSTYLLTEEEVFIPHPFEYWHYGRNERLSAFFSRNNHEVFYDEIC